MSVPCADRSVFRSTVGVLCVAAALALTSSGVQIARAADPEPRAAEAAGPRSVDPSLVADRDSAVDPPVCRAGAPSVEVARQQVLLRQRMLQIQREMARRAADKSAPADSAADVVVLNGRGYRYGSQPLSR